MFRCAEQGFEKWMEVELALSLQEYCYPVLYDPKWNYLKSTDDEYIADIRLQYNIELKDKKIRPDIFVTEKPIRYSIWTSKDTVRTWQVSDKNKITALRDHYDKQAPAHYIELKVEWWRINSKEEPKYFWQDCEKLFKESKIFKSYNVASRFAISVVTFFNKEENMFVSVESEEVFNAIVGLEDDIKKKYTGQIVFLYTMIGEYSAIIGAYRYEN